MSLYHDIIYQLCKTIDFILMPVFFYFPGKKKITNLFDKLSHLESNLKLIVA